MLRPAIGLPHAHAVNFLLKQFRDAPAHALLFLDDDMRFTARDIEALRSTLAADESVGVVSALSVCRRPPYRPICFKMDEAQTVQQVKPIPDAVQDVWLVGLACTLYRREAIIAAAEARGGALSLKMDNTLGEDGDMSRAVADAGYRVCLDSRVRVGHRADVTLYYNAEVGVDMVGETFGIRRL